MKRWIIKICVYAVLLSTIACMAIHISNLTENLKVSTNNEKAYAIENSGLKEKNRVFKLSIDQLNYYNDSLLVKMRNIAADNKIKESKIKSLQYQLEHFYKKDTIIIRDTIFRDPGFKLDTCIRDKWSSTCLHLAYPGNISIESQYNNEKYIICNSKREPIKPKKCKVANWFAKKHTVVEITVIDENPHVTTKKQKFIEIIK